jgi:hypothetical protein
MAVINGFAKGDRYEPDALDKLKRLILAAFPHVSRNLTEEEKRIIERLQLIPSHPGGMGSMADDV